MLDEIVKIIQIGGIGFIIWQLNISIRNTKVNTLKTEFEIFGKISEKEKAFVDEYEKLIKPNVYVDEESINPYKKYREQYLNELNLVCLYILNGYFTEKHFSQQYGEKTLSMHNKMDDNERKEYTSIDKICKKYKNRQTKISF